MGQLYLTNVDFLKNGVPASIIAALVSDLFPLHVMVLSVAARYPQVVATVGFGLMLAIGYVDKSCL